MAPATNIECHYFIGVVIAGANGELLVQNTGLDVFRNIEFDMNLRATGAFLAAVHDQQSNRALRWLRFSIRMRSPSTSNAAIQVGQRALASGRGTPLSLKRSTATPSGALAKLVAPQRAIGNHQPRSIEIGVSSFRSVYRPFEYGGRSPFRLCVLQRAIANLDGATQSGVTPVFVRAVWQSVARARLQTMRPCACANSALLGSSSMRCRSGSMSRFRLLMRRRCFLNPVVASLLPA